MSLEWKAVRLDEVGKIITGKTPKTSIEDNYGGNIPFLTPSDDMNIKTIYETNKTLTLKGLNEVKNCLLPKNSVCVSCIGSDLGKVVLTSENTVTNQQINSIIVNDDFDYNFIYYMMILVGKQLNFMSKSSTAVPIINKSTFSKEIINVPPLDEQRKISSILSNIDAKIENLLRINKNLTISLSLLFKNWFVDFNFLNENNKPYKTDNGKMKNSELGLIPNDWDIGILGDYIRIERGFSYKGKYLADEGIPLINLGNILPNSKFRLEKLKFYSGDFDEKYVVNVGDILVANTDLTQDRLVLGSPIIVPSLIDNDVIIYSHHINRLSNFKLPKYYIFYNLLSERYNHMVSGYATGTTVLAISKESISNYQIIIPPKELLLQFEEIAENIEKIKENNLLEIEKLAKLRDTLLPKLMSGEIDVSQINCDISMRIIIFNINNTLMSQSNLIEV